MLRLKHAPRLAWAGGALIWALVAIGLAWPEPRTDLAVAALALVTATSFSALCWPLPATLAASLIAVLAFNWQLVPPYGSLQVELHQHLVLLLALGLCAGLVSTLVARQRRAVLQAEQAGARSTQLRTLADALRDTDDALPALLQALQQASDAAVHLTSGTRLLGQPSAHQRSGLAQCLQQGAAFGPGTGRHEMETDWYLPLRGQHQAAGGQSAFGAACVAVAPGSDWRHLQALCDQAGQALERVQALAQAEQARSQAEQQRLRNTLLAAIAHDHRTPLASILGAASSLREQADRLSPAQRAQLASRIEGEAQALVRITDNSLQLARLDAGALALHRDWESPEELVGSVLGRLRLRDATRRIKAYVQPGLPLLRCDAVLLVQLLDNLLDNALRHGGEGAVDLRAEAQGEQLLLAVRDRGPGVLLAERERIFEPFERGDSTAATARGTGVGLALCRAVALAHGGTLRWHPREGGGSSFECRLPLSQPPTHGAPE